MALIDGRGEVIPDDWIYPDKETTLQVNTILPLDMFLAVPEGVEISRPIGVLVRSDASVEHILSPLDRIDVVVVEFPKFRDGRGLSIARILREKYAFKGDIRAIGHVLPDQFAALLRCGFSSLVTPPEHPPEQWKLPSESGSQSHAGQLLHRLVGRGTTNHPTLRE
jgi:uncharacterized protein (DUF934 family)